MDKHPYDVIIVGGGPSGLMAAIAAGTQGARTLLVDKGNKLGRKLGISGGGRCNVTNNKPDHELIQYIPGNGRFLHSALAAFGSQDIVAFFEGLGIRLKEEDNGRMFPVSDKAKTVVDALVGRVHSLGIAVRTNVPVRHVLYRDGCTVGLELAGGERAEGRSVVIATGGKSVPHTGSTGDGYAWAEAAGHTITELYPTEVPLTSAEPFIRNKELQGLSLRNVALTVWNPKGKKLVRHEGDMIFTHFGLSGPAALRCSQFVVKTKKQFQAESVTVTIDLYPDRAADEIYDQMLAAAKTEAKKSLKNVLKPMLPDRLIPLLLGKAGLKGEVTYDQLPRQPLEALARLTKSFPVDVNGTLSLEEAFVTGGGVHIKEVDPRTMGSKLMEGLYFCGEILDIHGYTGGYNITAAFSTGYTAGKHAAEYALEASAANRL